MFQTKDQILQLPKKFEIFVLTGQAEAYEARIDDLHYRADTRNLHEESRRIVQKRAFASACSQASEDSLHNSTMAWHCA